MTLSHLLSIIVSTKNRKDLSKTMAFHAQNLFYNAKEDYFVSTMGQHMEKQVLQSENKIMDIYLG